MSDSKDTKVQPGYLGNLDDKQQEALEGMRKEFAEDAKALETRRKAATDAKEEYTDTLQLDDYELLRRLRARDFKVKDATKSLRDTLDFRLKYDVANILKTPPQLRRTQALMKGTLQFEVAYAKDGIPVYMELTGRIKKSVGYKYVRPLDFKYSHMEDMEQLRKMCIESSKKNGRNIETLYTIMDLQGLELEHKNFLGHLQAACDIDEAHYPETLATIYLLNCPTIFPVLWGLIKLFLDPVTASKVRMLKSDYKQVLLDEVFGTVAELPVLWGGEKKVFGARPSAQEVIASFDQQMAALDLKEVTIGAGSTKELTMDAKGGETVQWFFRNASNNVNASVRFEPSGGGLKIIVLEKKYGTELEWGQFTAPTDKPGKVTVVLNNSFSWMRSKTVNTCIRKRAFDASQGDVAGEHRAYAWANFGSEKN